MDAPTMLYIAGGLLAAIWYSTERWVSAQKPERTQALPQAATLAFVGIAAFAAAQAANAPYVKAEAIRQIIVTEAGIALALASLLVGVSFGYAKQGAKPLAWMTALGGLLAWIWSCAAMVGPTSASFDRSQMQCQIVSIGDARCVMNPAILIAIAVVSALAIVIVQRGQHAFQKRDFARVVRAPLWAATFLATATAAWSGYTAYQHGSPDYTVASMLLIIGVATTIQAATRISQAWR